MEESINLHFVGGGSDKVYNAELLDCGNGTWTVNFEYGRRGSALTSGSKVVAVSYGSAKKAYDKIVSEKTGKGYQIVGGGQGNATSPAPSSPKKAKATEFDVMLLNAIDDVMLEKLIKDPKWGAQEKMDGERRPFSCQVINSSMSVAGYNRKGQEVAIATETAKEVLKLAAGDDIHLDSEDIGGNLFVFDAMKFNGIDLTDKTFEDRYSIIDAAIGSKYNHIQVVQMFKTETAKRALVERVKAAGGEGVVFHKLDSKYVAGRPNSKGNALKFKFVESASCVVSKVNGKRSVGLWLQDKKGDFVDVGNVTIPPNHEVPSAGSLIEVEYLYAYRDGCLYQPVYKGQRSDIDAKDCNLSQLKYKPEVDLNKELESSAAKDEEASAYSW